MTPRTSKNEQERRHGIQNENETMSITNHPELQVQSTSILPRISVPMGHKHINYAVPCIQFITCKYVSNLLRNGRREETYTFYEYKKKAYLNLW